MALGGALREVFAIFGVEVDKEKNLEKGHHEVEGLKEAFEGLVAAFASSELIHMTREFGEELGHLKVVSEQTGIATDQLQELDFAAQLTGGSVEEMNNSLVLLQRSLGHAQATTGPQVQALNELGIAFRDSAGQPKPLNDILPQIFDNFGKLKSEAQQAEVATSLFGRSGVKLLPTLRKGSEGMEEFREQLGELGGPVSEETIEKAEEMNHAFAKMDRAFFNLKATIGAEVFPQVEKLVEGVAHGIAKIREFTQGTTLAESGTLALGIAIAGPLLSALGPLIKPGLKFAAIFLAMDDAIAFLEGKDSVIGAILNGFFGPETTQGVRDWLQSIVGSFKELSASGVSIFHAIDMAWGDVLNDMFTAFDSFILKVDQGWNSMVDALHLPDSFKIDTTDAEARIAGDKAQHQAFEQEAYDSTHPEDVKRRQQEYAEANGTGRRDNPLTKDDIRGAFGLPPKPGAGAGPEVRHGVGLTPEQETDPQALFKHLREQSQARAASLQGQYGAAFVPPTTAPVPATTGHNEYHVDARTTVHATTQSSAKDIADLVGQKQKESWRNAYESITQRSAAP